MPDTRKPLITVLLLCYNQERYVGEAVDGVLAQTYSPLEILIVDDCSSDRTGEVIAAKLSDHPNRRDARFIRNERNLQWRGSCEVGLDATQGSFVVPSCGDDIMLPNMIEEMANVWVREDASLITTNVHYMDEHSNLLGRTARELDRPADDSFETLARDGVNACCFGASIGFEREVYSTFGLPPPHLEAFDIMLPFYAYLLKGARFIREPLLKYRVHGQNTSLSLIAEKSDRAHQLRTREQSFIGHIAHAVLMQEELDWLSVTMPDRHAELAPRIGPLLTIQTVDMSKKLVRTRSELRGLKG